VVARILTETSLTCFWSWSSGGPCGGPDPHGDVLWGTQLVYRQHPAPDLQPRREGPDCGAVQGAAEAPAEPAHPGALDPQRALDLDPQRALDLDPQRALDLDPQRALDLDPCPLLNPLLNQDPWIISKTLMSVKDKELHLMHHTVKDTELHLMLHTVKYTELHLMHHTVKDKELHLMHHTVKDTELHLNYTL